jgi:hypothetical protein
MGRRSDFSLPVGRRAGEGELRLLGERIVKAIAEVATELGRTPSLVEFAGRAGISKHHVMHSFSKWNEAVRAAGLEPGRLYKRLGLDELLTDWGEAVRKKGGVPSRLWYLRHGKHSHVTLQKRFGRWEAIPAAFRKFAEGRPEWSDVVVLVERAMRLERTGSSAVRPERAGGRGGRERQDGEMPRDRTATHAARRRRGKSFLHALHPPLARRAVYGNPVNFRGMRHEPTNEQGVVLLFGMMAEELGYLVETVQAGFPDCEAKRRVGPDKWQRVRIEFEFESKNFPLHGHSVRGCDVIVCWRHNWKECPKEIEVVELCEVMRS